MYKYLLITLLPLSLVAQMKCTEGKCGSSMEKTVAKIEKKVETTTTMKCESGKCTSGKDISSMKDIPKKIQTPHKVTLKQLFNVTTVQVKEENITQEQINYGYVVIPDAAKIDVTAWYSGFVEKLYTDTRYDKITKGDALVKVYSPEVYKAKQDYLNSLNYNSTRAAPAMLQSAMTKLQLLNVDKKEIEKIRTEKIADRFTTIYAPSSGWLFEKSINQGSSFTVNKKLFQIVNLDTVWIEVKLFQEQLHLLNTLNTFTIKVKGINEIFEANKSLLYPMLSPKEATYTLRLIVNNHKGLLTPGMYAKIYASSKSKKRLIIPRTAAIRKSGKWYAFLSTEFKGEYEPIAIEVKPLANKYFEVTKGLNTNDFIVNNALFMMDSDAQINSIY